MSMEEITLVAALIAAVTSLVGLFFTRKTGKELVQLESTLGKSREIEKLKRDLNREQLSEFYDPIFALLSVNKKIFDSVGPSSSTRLDHTFPEEETAAVWNELAERVIVPNNALICQIVQTKLHLLSPVDDIAPYLEFAAHAHTYQTFRSHPYEAYRLFQFPAGFLGHVESHRDQLRNRLLQLLETGPQ